MADNCALCGLSAKEHKNMERDKRRGFHAFSVADPKDQEREQAAREWLTEWVNQSDHFEEIAALVSLLRTREEAAYKHGQEEMRERAADECSRVWYAAESQTARNIFSHGCVASEVAIRALPIKGVEESECEACKHRVCTNPEHPGYMR